MKNKLIKVIEICAVLLWMLFILLPIFTIIVGSLKTDAEFYNTAAYAIPKTFYFGNYQHAITSELITGLVTTSILIIGTIVFSTIFSCSVAYVFERFIFSQKKQIILLFWCVSLIPLTVMQIFIFQILNKLGMYDSIIGMILLYSISDIVIINIFREYINKIPISVDKAALISGANHFQIFYKIILPNMRPAIMIVTIYKMMQVYNDFYLQFLYLPTKKTLSTYLYNFISPYNINWPMICATVVILIIPVIIILCIMQWKNDQIIKQIK